MRVFPGHWGIMTYRYWQGAKRTLAALVPAALVLAGGATGGSAQRAGGQMPATVDAVYRITFTALGDIGHFHFKSTVNSEAYTLAADAKIDTAIFDYRGNMSSNGAVPSRTPRPVDYKFNYKQKTFLKKKKLKALNIAFNDGAVSKVTFTPHDELSAKAVPVTPEQLKNALDPLSGVMALSLDRHRQAVLAETAHLMTASSASTSSLRPRAAPAATTCAGCAWCRSPVTSRGRVPPPSSRATSCSSCGRCPRPTSPSPIG